MAQQNIDSQLATQQPPQFAKWQAKDGRHLGTKYQGDPRGCQDYAIAKANGKGAWAIACDGAGSSAQSQIASKAIAEAISSYFENGLIENIISSYALQKAIYDVLHDTLQKLCQNKAQLLQDFHTTVLFVYHNFAKEPKEPYYYLGHIGDGMIVGVTEDGLEILSYSQTGEGASNQTYFADHVLSRAKYLRTQIKQANSTKYQKDYIGYMCFSDGVEDYVHLQRKIMVQQYQKKGRELLHPDLLAFFNNLAKVEDLGAMLNERWIKTDHTDDDCCLAIIKDKNKSCVLDFRQEHDFYARALDKQKKADELRRSGKSDTQEFEKPTEEMAERFGFELPKLQPVRVRLKQVTQVGL